MFQCPTCEQNTIIPVGGASVLPQNLHLGFEVEVAGYMSKMVSNITHKSHSVKEIFTVAKTQQMEISGALEEAKEVVIKLTGAIDKRMIEQKEQFEKMVGDIGHYTDMASQILQTHTDHEIVALGGLIPTELQATLKRVQTISLTPNQHSNISVSVKTDDLVRQLSKLGEISVFFPSPSSSTWMSTSVARVGTRYHVKVQSKTSKGEEYPHGGVEVKGEMRTKTHNGAVVYGEVEDHRDGTYTITLTPQTAGPHQFLITMDAGHGMVTKRIKSITHNGHTMTDISTLAKAHRMEMTGALEEAKVVVTKLTGAIDEYNRMIEEVEISKRNAFLVINQAFEILQQTSEERKKTLLSELEAISLSKTTALTLQKEQFEKMVGDIGHYTDMASQILQTHTDHEIVALGGLIPTELQATLKRVQTISLTPNQHSNISVSVKTDDLGEMRSKTHNGAVVYGEVEDHRDGTYTITLTPQTAGPHQILITMDGQHVQNSPNDLDVRPKCDYHTLCNAQQVIQCNKPISVAIHDNGDIYVGSTVHCIYVFDQAGQLKNTIGSRGSGDGQFSYPYGISIKGDVLYVADRYNHRVQKLTSSGKFLHKFGQGGSGQGQLNCPVVVIIDSNNKLIVSDSGNHRIHIFNENGGWLLTIDGKGSGNHSFSPWGLALDPQGNIHVAAFGSNTIKVFSKEGVYVRMYGDPNGPRGLAIDGEGYSLVSENSGHCLSIYDP
eukprot:Em0066g21a